MMSLVAFVTGSNRQLPTRVFALVKAYPPISTPDTNGTIVAMVDVFMYFCARNGLTMTKHISHEMTVDRNCDTHTAPPMPEDRQKVTVIIIDY